MKNQEHPALAMARNTLQTEADRVSFERAMQLEKERYEMEMERKS